MIVLFDMDGTLVDVSTSYRQAIKQTVEALSGQRVDDQCIQSFKDRGGYNNDWDLTAQLLAELGHPYLYETVVDTFQCLYWGTDAQPNGLICTERWLLDTQVLQDMTQLYPLGIVTGRPRREAEWTLGHFGTAVFFPVLVALEDCPPGKGKPDPWGLQLAMKHWPGETAVYVGDSVDDQQAAQAASIRFIQVAPGSETQTKDINRIMEVLINEQANRAL